MKETIFAESLRRNIARVNEYKLGRDGTNGYCDCIGLIIGAIRLGGGKWNGIHGSNYAARNEMRTLEQIRSKNDLQLYDIVYKSKAQGEAGWSLPEKYLGGTDTRDYYHVGVVTGLYPLEITHCTGVQGGIKFDKSVGQWKWHGKLKKVEDGEAEKPAKGTARTKAKAVALRKGPTTEAGVFVRIPQGSSVTLKDPPDGWRYVVFNNQPGWVMEELLEIGGDDK